VEEGRVPTLSNGGLEVERLGDGDGWRRSPKEGSEEEGRDSGGEGLVLISSIEVEFISINVESQGRNQNKGETRKERGSE